MFAPFVSRNVLLDHVAVKSRLVRTRQATDEAGGRTNWRAYNCARGASNRTANGADGASDRATDRVASPCAVAGWGVLRVSRDRRSCQQNCENEWFGYRSSLQTRTLRGERLAIVCFVELRSQNGAQSFPRQ